MPNRTKKSTAPTPDSPAILTAQATMASVGARILDELKRLTDEAKNLRAIATESRAVAIDCEGRPRTAEDWCSQSLDHYEGEIREVVVRMLQDVDKNETEDLQRWILSDGGSVVAAA